MIYTKGLGYVAPPAPYDREVLNGNEVIGILRASEVVFKADEGMTLTTREIKVSQPEIRSIELVTKNTSTRVFRFDFTVEPKSLKILVVDNPDAPIECMILATNLSKAECLVNTTNRRVAFQAVLDGEHTPILTHVS